MLQVRSHVFLYCISGVGAFGKPRSFCGLQSTRRVSSQSTGKGEHTGSYNVCDNLIKPAKKSIKPASSNNLTGGFYSALTCLYCTLYFEHTDVQCRNTKTSLEAAVRCSTTYLYDTGFELEPSLCDLRLLCKSHEKYMRDELIFPRPT